MTDVPNSRGPEAHTIYQIPLDQRHGSPRDLFTVWFGSNIMMLTIITGALSTTVFGLSFWPALLAVVLGNMVGGLFMALHAAQGPQLGVPQMVQTRGQFGSIGAMAVICLVVVMYVGFFASNLVLGGQSLHSVVTAVPEKGCILLLAAISLAATIYGHDLIHAYTRLLTLVSGVALLLCFIWILGVNGVSAATLAHGDFTASGFLGAMSTAALWQIAYAPYVSDYSRYLPPGTGSTQAFWASYAGCVLGSVFPMVLGALLGGIAGGGDVVTTLTTQVGPLAVFIIPALSLGIAATNAMNLYCGALSAITVVQTLLPSWRAGHVGRAGTAVFLCGCSLLIALGAEANFLETYTNFILLLLYVMVPWTAINLADFYLVRHGEYDVDSFFRVDGGVYGRYCWPALAAYVFGILVQIPFVSNSLYTGPVAKLLNGADISWIVGLVFVTAFYLWLMRHERAAQSLVRNAG
ncbi:purine-cytosine permease family protein [Acetobacter vaccinii]|uniref:Cytosine permease n=1 Tax=Acetobacter vaccinii TaxID=2592655 RepID=A0A5C1YMF6_9PROT|nr:cytosine permease [Acetobacter vaccinii]QEO17083.1 cytosine permease [Acetobacter vaccinii]